MGRRLACGFKAELMMETRQIQEKGFTVTELLVATFIVVFTAAGTFVLLGSATQFTHHRTHRYEAVGYAVQTLDTLKNYVTTEPTTDSAYQITGDPSPPCGAGPSPRYALLDQAGWDHCHPLPEGILRDQLRGRRSYTVEDIDINGDTETDYKRVTVTIDWTEPR